MNQLLQVIFRGRRHSGCLDLEAVETAVRGTMHRAGAAVLSELLSCSETVPRQVPCACGQQACYHDTAGHGPQYRLTRSVNGKTVTETFAGEADRRKAQREVAEFHRFQQLSQELLQLNEKICRLRPVEEQDPPTPQEKKRLKRSAKKSPKK